MGFHINLSYELSFILVNGFICFVFDLVHTLTADNLRRWIEFLSHCLWALLYGFHPLENYKLLCQSSRVHACLSSLLLRHMDVRCNPCSHTSDGILLLSWWWKIFIYRCYSLSLLYVSSLWVHWTHYWLVELNYWTCFHWRSCWHLYCNNFNFLLSSGVKESKELVFEFTLHDGLLSLVIMLELDFWCLGVGFLYKFHKFDASALHPPRITWPVGRLCSTNGQPQLATLKTRLIYIVLYLIQK